MAENCVRRFETIEAANAWLADNPGVGNRRVFRIDWEGGEFYVVAIHSFKARTIAATLLGVKASLAEAGRSTAPTLQQRIAGMSAEDRAKLRGLLKRMEEG
jgi:hypothetical protein